MHIVVCIKQVPDSAQIRVHPVTNTIMRQGCRPSSTPTTCLRWKRLCV
jgi:electron transfer flavoprotein alpha/beta subunit